MQDLFGDSVIRKWFIYNVSIENIPYSKVITTGSGPFEEDEFDDFLLNNNFEIFLLNTSLNVLIIGKYDWYEDELDKLIELRKGKELKVYSQEMFLLYLLTNKDPYNDKELLQHFGENHPALNYLKESGFDWPETNIVPSSGFGNFNVDIDWPQVGLLSYMGYKVGENGIIKIKRHKILEQIYTSNLPNVMNEDYMEEWGAPKSKERLHKLSRTIATFCRNAKKRTSADMDEAIRNWEDDLEWLKNKFYKGRYRFFWPSTQVKY